MIIALWAFGVLFTFGFVLEEETKWYHVVILILILCVTWPVTLGSALREVIKR